MTIHSERLKALRSLLIKEGVQGFIIPLNDEFQGEYVPASAKRLEWLTGFTGSNGIAIVLQDEAAFFTDGRYTLQAAEQVSSDYQQCMMPDVMPWEWVANKLRPSQKIGFDPWLHTLRNVEAYRKKQVPLQPCANLVDKLWHDRPHPPKELAKIHPLEYAGVSSEEKRTKLADFLSKKGADSLLLTAPDSICWLLNIRGNDVPHTPFVLCFALAHQDGTVDLFVDKDKLSKEVAEHLGNNVRTHAIGCVETVFPTFVHHKKIQADPTNAAMWFFDALHQAHATVIEDTDPCQLWKACKNPVEVAGMYAAHVRDGAALTTFLHWLATNISKETITEISLAEKLYAFRAKNNLFQDTSFDTIAGYAGNGAIVHYHATEKSSKTLEKKSLLLLDSGGQYLDGTTDVTRTVALGTPTQNQKDHFTLVLKGHIALAMAVFPEGTTGSQLDALARYPLWQAGLDYEHGTGHGVGSYLSVHEGPQRISKLANATALQPGMVVSNEPGYYLAGEYGIRIESLVVVVEKPDFSKTKRYFGFDTLTRAPIDLQLVNFDLLTQAEKNWLESYHQQVCKDLEPWLDKDTKAWLKDI